MQDWPGNGLDMFIDILKCRSPVFGCIVSYREGRQKERAIESTRVCVCVCVRERERKRVARLHRNNQLHYNARRRIIPCGCRQTGCSLTLQRTSTFQQKKKKRKKKQREKKGKKRKKIRSLAINRSSVECECEAFEAFKCHAI